jgi:hypothetical protein
VDRHGGELVGFSILSVTGRAERISTEGETERRWKNAQGGITIRRRGYRLVQGEGPERDFFMTGNSGVLIFVSQRVVDWAFAARLTGIAFMSLEEDEWDIPLGRGGDPGPALPG